LEVRQFGALRLDREDELDLRRLMDGERPGAAVTVGAPDIEVKGVTRRYGATVAVDDVTFAVGQGHVLSLLGPSGCGKTTTMRMIAGLIRPDAGDIAIKGRSVARVPVHRRNIGMLFQNYALFPHLDVAGNLRFGLEMRKLAKAEIARRVAQALAMVKLDGFAARLPHELSGGQQQRVALARALVVEPAVLLLDEPFGALDKKLRETMQIELRQLQQRLGITTLMVTHDQEEALTLSDEIAVMRNGKVEQLGPPAEVYERPVSRFVANFIGVSNFFTGRVTRADRDGLAIATDDGITLAVPGSAPAGQTVTVALRPEAIALEPASGAADGAPNALDAVIDQIVYRGLNTQYHLGRAGGEPLIVVRQNAAGGDAAAGLAPGAKVRARWAAERNRIVRDDP
jgi:spermidine/putrescine ABC transporter ATP-binding subunit